MSTVLRRDPRCRGQIGGAYFAEAAGRRWRIEGEPGLWMVGEDIHSFTPEQTRAFLAAPNAVPSAVVFSLAEARAWFGRLEGGDL